MLTRLIPIEFIGRAPTGKTQPAFVVCEGPDGEEVTVLVKLSGRSERSVAGLAMEAFAACLAADLGLGVPQPHVIEMDAEWIDAVEMADASWAAAARTSSPAAFGSRRLPDGFTTWTAGSPLAGPAVETAASALLFDAIAKNADRRPENPNCLRLGNQLRIFDHELCFPEFLLGLGDAWAVGGLQVLATPGWHIFRDALAGRKIDWCAAVAAWRGLSDAMVEDYGAALPPEWAAASPVIRRVVERVKLARDNIDACVEEVQRVLLC